MEHGNYYDAVITAINRLRRNTDNKKSSETLRTAYPMAVKYYDDRANGAIASNVEFKWREVIQHYNTLQSMYDEIQRSPGALQVIPNAVNYQAKLMDARQKAAEESYSAGIMALGAGDRGNAKKAYYLFINSNDYSPGYKDVTKKIEDARWAATIKVAVEPIPVASKNYALNAQYFDNKLNEYLQANQTSEFIRFYKLADAKSQRINPDHIVQLSFEEFSIGQVYVNEKEMQMEKDSVVVAYAYTDLKGKLLQKEVESPKILPPVGAKEISTSSDSNSGKTDEKKVADTKSVDVNTGKVDDKKTEDKKTEEEKKSDDKGVVADQKEEKPDEKKNDDKGAGSDKKSEDEKKNDDKSQGDKNEDKQDGNKSEDQNKNNEGKKSDQPDSNEDKKDEKKDNVNKGNAEEQVTLCHQPPGKPSERKSLTVPQSAVKAHLAHGDVLGECKTDEKGKDKGNGTKGKDGGGEGMASLMSIDSSMPVMIASTSNTNVWYLFGEINSVADTTKIFGKVKATVHHYKKTITSRGVLNFRIIDAKTRAVISEERMPSESIWISEWLTYNGDSRALTPEQEKLARQKESQPPSNQDLFAEFTKPLFDQITNKISQYYKNY
jgi:hypothetical protein